MHRSDREAAALSPREGWNEVHSTLERARSTMHVAGATEILLLWGAIASLGLISGYAIETLAPGFAAGSPWFYAPLWGALAAVGMAGSAVMGHRAGRRDADGAAVREAGMRVFLFWLAVVLAAFLVPLAAGMWNADAAAGIARVSIGIVALGHILFGIFHRTLIAYVGLGIAVAYYVPSYLAGDAAPLVTGNAILVVVAACAAWTRRGRTT